MTGDRRDESEDEDEDEDEEDDEDEEEDEEDEIARLGSIGSALFLFLFPLSSRRIGPYRAVPFASFFCASIWS